MAIYKQQLQRICLIDSAIQSLHKPTKEIIRIHVCRGLSLSDDGLCKSTIEKDLFFMKAEFDAPIECNRTNNEYSYRDPDYNFSHAFLRYWSAYLILPNAINEIIYAD